MDYKLEEQFIKKRDNLVAVVKDRLIDELSEETNDFVAVTDKYLKILDDRGKKISEHCGTVLVDQEKINASIKHWLGTIEAQQELFSILFEHSANSDNSVSIDQRRSVVKKMIASSLNDSIACINKDLENVFTVLPRAGKGASPER